MKASNILNSEQITTAVPHQMAFLFSLILMTFFLVGCSGGGGGGAAVVSTKTTSSSANTVTNTVSNWVETVFGGNSATTLSSACTITEYSFSGSIGTINEVAKTVAVTVPFGTNVTALVATFSTTGTSVKVGVLTQSSTVSANNFSAPVIYTVTAADGSTATYTVSVTIAPNSAKAITAYSFAGYSGAAGVINEVAKTVAVTVPFGTNVTALVATFSTTGTSVKIGAAVQTSTVSANNFSAPAIYTVTAADGSTATYTVSVTIAPNSAKAITAYSFAGYSGAAGVINEVAKTVAVTVPFGTNVTALVATFSTTGTSVKIGAAVQTSTVSANNFSAPVIYTVTAADGSTATYTVTVTIAPNSAKAITAYSFAGLPDSVGVITEPAHTILVSVLPGTDKTALVASFTTTGTIVKIGAAVQTSAATANDFTAVVPYTVTAGDASTVVYNVTVTSGVGPVPINLGTAGNFAILSKAQITDVPSSTITGNVGASPITGASIHLVCAEVTGTIYSVDAAGPLPCRVTAPALLTTAVSDMEAAYTATAGRAHGTGLNLDLQGGVVTAQTLAPGTYTWNSVVNITDSITLNGGANDVWIFQITGTLGIASGKSIILAGGAQAKNIFWQVADVVTLQTNSHFEGIIMAQTNIAMQTGATINGRLLAQTEVTLQTNTITQP